MTTPAGTIRVARDGSRGWHFIALAKYEADPKAFTVLDDDLKPVAVDPLGHDADGKKGGALRDDGPTVAEFVEAGYLAANYPPAGYASRSTDDEIEAAIAAQEPDGGGNGNSGANGTGAPDGQPVPIPADWRDMHHTKIIALAKELHGDFEATADKTMTERARSIIEAAEADRANPPAKTE